MGWFGGRNVADPAINRGPSRTRVAGPAACLAAVLASAALLIPSSASANPTATYLALGDSVAFGYSTQQYNEGQSKGDPATGFERGYPNAYLKLLLKKSPGTQLTNDSCPNETTESFIGKNPLLLNKLNTALKKTQEEGELPEVTGNESEPEAHTFPNCEYQEVWNLEKTPGKGGPLHHPYVGESQLENTIKTIKEDSTSGVPVTTVSLDIGTYDIFHVLAKTEFEVRKEIEAMVLATVALKEPEFAQAVAAAAQKRIEAALLGERPNVVGECEAQALQELLELKILKGEVPQAITKCVEVASLPFKVKDEAEHNYAKEVEELVAAGAEQYVAEHRFELEAEGEKKATEKIHGELKAIMAQINSNVLGILYAIRNAETLGLSGINYQGKIIFQGAYSAYGKLFQFAEEGVNFVNAHGGPQGPYAVDNGRCAVHAETEAEENEHIFAGHCEAATLHIGFNTLFHLMNFTVFETAEGKMGTCFSDPSQRFDPANTRRPNLEPEHLRKWTNMVNVKETNGKPDGPDTTPTVAGHKVLASEMVKREAVCHAHGDLGF